MDLARLLSFDNIAIQCCDDPSDDSLAAGFALYEYFREKGKPVKLFYSGKERIQKKTPLEMVRLLKIPIVYEEKPEEIEGLLILVACQYDTGRATKVLAKNIAVIDNCVEEATPPILHEIKPTLGSCSTLVWSMLNDVGFNMSVGVTTALYYGLYKATNNFTEIRHPLDRDLKDASNLQRNTLDVLKDTNFSLFDLQQTSSALQNIQYDQDKRLAVIPVRPYLPDLLGLVSDFAIQADEIDVVVAYCEIAGGYKYSIHSTVRECDAAELAHYLNGDNLGAGGGDAEHAGGFISLQNYIEKYPQLPISDYIARKLQQYVNTYTVVDVIDPDDLSKIVGLPYRSYRKLPTTIGYVPCHEITDKKVKLDIRMLEGDISIVAHRSTYLMIGMAGEVYPIEQRRFTSTYTVQPELAFVANFEYSPMVYNTVTGEHFPLMQLAKTCQSKENIVKACQLTQPIKLFTKWDEDRYVAGEKGDWLVRRSDDPADVYIITEPMFLKLYERVN